MRAIIAASTAAADLAIVLVVDPRHLLIARRHHAQLPRRAAIRVGDDAPGADRRAA